jgi:hypothetical protein
LPSSLTEGRSFTLGGFSLPTSVGLRYGRIDLWLEAFLGGVGADDFRTIARARHLGYRCETGIFLDLRLPTDAPILSIRWVHLPYRVPPLLLTMPIRCRTFSPACHRLRLLRPRLRTRLTLGRLTLPRNPQAFGVSGSCRHCATHSGIRTSLLSTSPCSLASLICENAPLPLLFPAIPSFGTKLEPPYVVGATALDQ